MAKGFHQKAKYFWSQSFQSCSSFPDLPAATNIAKSAEAQISRSQVLSWSAHACGFGEWDGFLQSNDFLVTPGESKSSHTAFILREVVKVTLCAHSYYVSSQVLRLFAVRNRFVWSPDINHNPKKVLRPAAVCELEKVRCSWQKFKIPTSLNKLNLSSFASNKTFG